MAKDPGTIVTALMQKFDIEHPSIEQITSHLTADAVWHNMPAEPASGADAVRRAMEPSMSWSWRGFETVHQVVQGNVVLNEIGRAPCRERV